MLLSFFISREGQQFSNCFVISLTTSQTDDGSCPLSVGIFACPLTALSKFNQKLLHSNTISKSSLKKQEAFSVVRQRRIQIRAKRGKKDEKRRCLEWRILKSSWRRLSKQVCDRKYIDKNESNLRSNAPNLFPPSIDFRPSGCLTWKLFYL